MEAEFKRRRFQFSRSTLCMCVSGVGVFFACVWGAINFCLLTQAQAADKKVSESERLVRALTSRNKEPKIVLSTFNDEVPIFAGKYDWSEQDRVWKVFETVVKTKSDDIWWQLVAHVDDSEYALTSDNDEFVDMTARNFSVGSLCEHIARRDLGWPYLRHLQTDEWRIRPESVFHPQDVFWKDEKKGAGKPLYLIQIEVCQKAVDEMAKATGITAAYGGESPARKFKAKEKAAFVEAVNKEILELRTTKRAITSAEVRLPGMGNRRFRQERAKTAEEIYKEHGRKE